MGLITKGMGVVLKHIKKPGKAFTRAGDKWYKKTQKLQRSKKKSEKIRLAKSAGKQRWLRKFAETPGPHQQRKNYRKRNRAY